MHRLSSWLILTVFLTTTAATHADEPTSEPKDPAATSPSKKKDEIGDILNSMGYPELQVVPRASDRLGIEARSEAYTWAITHWTIELSGLVTMGIGLTSGGSRRTDLNPTQVRDTNTIAAITTTVGAGWLAGGILMGADRPYRAGMNQLSKYPGKDDRSTLLRERLAEEALERPAKTMRVLKYVAVGTNFAMNVTSAVYANTPGKVNCGVAAVLSFLPLMFEDHSIDVFDKQMEYKKKIYTPIASASFHYEPLNKSMTPMTDLTWTF